MPIASSDMYVRVLRLIEQHWRKALRYCGVSVVNVGTGLSTLAVCLTVFDMMPVAANLTAWMVSTIPAYLLSRYWVWRQYGSHSMKAEILPFWILALVGLVLSSTAIGIAGALTDNTLILLAVNLTAYGIVWVAKYLVLDNLMWRHPTHAERPVEVV